MKPESDTEPASSLTPRNAGTKVSCPVVPLSPSSSQGSHDSYRSYPSYVSYLAFLGAAVLLIALLSNRATNRAPEPATSAVEELKLIPPLPFGRGEGRGEWSESAPPPSNSQDPSH